MYYTNRRADRRTEQKTTKRFDRYLLVTFLYIPIVRNSSRSAKVWQEIWVTLSFFLLPGNIFLWRYCENSWTSGRSWHFLPRCVPPVGLCVFVGSSCNQGEHGCHHTQWKAPDVGYRYVSGMWQDSIVTPCHVRLKTLTGVTPSFCSS